MRHSTNALDRLIRSTHTYTHTDTHTHTHTYTQTHTHTHTNDDSVLTIFKFNFYSYAAVFNWMLCKYTSNEIQLVNFFFQNIYWPCLL